MTEDTKILKMARFIHRHSRCPGEILVALDIVPDVIRLDCSVCTTNCQVHVPLRESETV